VKGDLERLIAAVEAGTFLMDILTPGDCERDAYSAFSGSLDAALRLHEALLPGWGWAVDWRDDGFVMAWLSPNLNRMSEAERATAPLVDERNYSGKPARAWLLAILRALAGKKS
jgi:hypothetical protein